MSSGWIQQKPLESGFCVVVGVLKTYCNRERATSELRSLLEQAELSKPRLRLPKREIGKSTRKLSPSVAAEIVALYQTGTPAHEIAERLNIHRITVSNYLERAAIAKRPKGITNVQIDEAVAAYEAGDSFATIARRLGVSPMTISFALRRRGVMIRPRPGRGYRG